MDIEFEKLWRISRNLHLSLEPDEALCKILTALTAGEGLAFNRAFLYENKGGILTLRMKLGAETEDEAYRVWEEISKKPHGLEDLLKTCEGEHPSVSQVKGKEIHIEELPKNFLDNGPVKVESPEDIPSCLREAIDYLPFAIVPLKGKEKLLGLILVDNKFNKDPITETDIRTLELYAALVSNVIERTNLFYTLQKKQEELEQAYRELQEYHKRVLSLEKFAAVGEIASTFAHELRTPITIIGGYAELIYRDKELPQNLKPKIETILRTTKRMDTIIKNLSSYIKSPKPSFEMINTEEFIDYILSIVEIDIKRKNIDLEVKTTDKRVLGDPSLLEQALLNILRNSIDALPNGGKISIKTYEEVGFLCIEISDNGSGIPETMMKNLFIPFHTTKRQGLGLGLAITKKIVLLHNGRIEVKSEEGKGTVVKIFLPLEGGYYEKNTHS